MAFFSILITCSLTLGLAVKFLEKSISVAQGAVCLHLHLVGRGLHCGPAYVNSLNCVNNIISRCTKSISSRTNTHPDKY